MAYGQKYSGTFSSTAYNDLVSKDYIVKLLFDGYVGSSSTILLNGFSEKDKSYGDSLIGIKEVKFTFGVVSDTLGIDDFYPDSERHAKVELYSVVGVTETLVRRGFLMEENASEEYADGNRILSISATDGLELLNGNKYFDDNEKEYNVYPYSERVSILTIIRRCFVKIGTDLNFNTAFNMHNGASTPSAIYDILAYRERGQKDLIGKSCYEVLSMMAESLNCQVFQNSGEWWFVHLLGQRAGGQFYRKWSSLTGDYISGGAIGNSIPIGYTEDVQGLGGGIISLNRPYKRIIAEVGLEGYSNGLLNSTFVPDGATYPNWYLNSLTLSNGGSGTKIDPYYLQINNAQASLAFDRVEYKGVYQDVIVGDVAAGDDNLSIARKQVRIKGKVLSGGCKTALLGVYLTLETTDIDLVYYLSQDGNWNLVTDSATDVLKAAIVAGTSVKRAECIEVNLIDKDGVNFTKYSEFDILSETVKEASDSKMPWYAYGIGGSGFSGVKGLEATDINKATIAVVLYKGLEETDVVLATPYVRFANIDLQVIDSLTSQRSESLKYVQETSTTASRELKIKRALIDFDDENQVLAITASDGPTVTWVTNDDSTPRELIDHLNKEILYVTNLPQKIFDGDLKGFPDRFRLGLFDGYTTPFLPVSWNFDFRESIANGVRYQKLWDTVATYTSKKYGITTDGREVPFGDNGIPTIITNDDDPPRKGSPVQSTKTGVFGGNLVIDKTVSLGALNFINSAGLVTDYIRPSGTQFFLKADSGTEELIATNANAWMFNGNTIKAKKTIGSLDGFDVGIIRGGTEIATIKSTGIDILADLTTVGANITRNTLERDFAIKSGDYSSNPYTGFGMGMKFHGKDYSNVFRDYAYIDAVMTSQAESANGSGDTGFRSALKFYVDKDGTTPSLLAILDSTGATIIGTTSTTDLNITNGAIVGYAWKCTNATTGAGEWTSVATSERWMGTWNASSGSAPSGSPTTGDYYTVTTAGTYSGVTYALNDYSYYNGTAWIYRPNGYTLVTATSSIKGGIKIGTTLEIAADVVNQKSGIVTVGTYRSVTVDTYGRVTGGTNPTTIGGYGIIDYDSLWDTRLAATIVPIANGGTGSATKNFVDLTTAQTIAGIKTFSVDAVINGLTVGRGRGSKDTNVAFGISALNSNSNGSWNTALGSQSMPNNISGGANTALGYLSLNSIVSGNGSVGVGARSLYHLTNGSSFVVGVGYSASDTNNMTITGSIFIGAFSKPSTVVTTSTNEIVFGYQAVGNGSNTVTIGNSSITANYLSGSLKYGTLLKPNNVAGTSGQFLGTDGTNDSWQSITQTVTLTDSPFERVLEGIYLSADTDESFFIGTDQENGQGVLRFKYYDDSEALKVNEMSFDREDNFRPYLYDPTADVPTYKKVAWLDELASVNPTLQTVTTQGRSSTDRLQYKTGSTLTNYALASDIVAANGIDSVLGAGNIAISKTISFKNNHLLTTDVLNFMNLSDAGRGSIRTSPSADGFHDSPRFSLVNQNGSTEMGVRNDGKALRGNYGTINYILEDYGSSQISQDYYLGGTYKGGLTALSTGVMKLNAGSNGLWIDTSGQALIYSSGMSIGSDSYNLYLNNGTSGNTGDVFIGSVGAELNSLLEIHGSSFNFWSASTPSNGQQALFQYDSTLNKWLLKFIP
jgi:hypothetical protein